MTIISLFAKSNAGALVQPATQSDQGEAMLCVLGATGGAGQRMESFRSRNSVGRR